MIVFLVEESFAHAEIGQTAAGLNGERALILGHCVVEAALFGKILTASDGGAGAQANAALEDDVVGIDFDAAGLGAAKGLDGEAGFGAGHVDGFLLRISFGVDA